MHALVFFFILQGAVELLVHVDDELTGSEHSPLVLEVLVSVNISHNPADMIVSSTSKTVYTNAQGTGQFIQMSFELECSEDYYGSDCGAYCAPRDDNFGHFSCDRNGNIVCLSGFSNTATNCTECILSEGCCKLLYLVLSSFHSSSFCMTSIWMECLHSLLRRSLKKDHSQNECRLHYKAYILQSY